jgi:hypothetical protein
MPLLWNLVFLEQLQQLSKAGGPTVLEVDVLPRGNSKRRFKFAQPQRDDEIVVADSAGNLSPNFNLVSNPFFVYAVPGAHEKQFARSVSQGLLEFARPVIATEEPQDVGPYFVAQRREFGGKPTDKVVVFRVCMRNE